MLGIVQQLDVAQAQVIVAAQLLFGDLLAVDPGPVGRAEIAHHVVLAVETKDAMMAGNTGVLELNAVVRQAPDRDFPALELKGLAGKFGRLCD